MATSQQNNSQRSGVFPLDDLTYDLVTVLYEKSKALEAYDKYQRDAQGDQEISQLFQQIRQQDEQHIQQLREHLGRRLSTQSGSEQQRGATTSVS